jgi:hypothetical protein
VDYASHGDNKMHFMRGPFDIVLEGILVKLRHKIDIFHVFV